MNNTIIIKQFMDKHPVFALHPDRAREMGLEKKKIAFISFGSRKHYVLIKMDEGIQYDNVCISKKLVDELHLPDYPVYETYVRNNEIVIGPFIGILVSTEDKNITERRLYSMKDYVREYSKLHGAVVVFALDKTDTTNLLIEGYCYHPSTDFWQRGIFPYPSSIYRTIGLSAKWRNHFLSVIGDVMFNNVYFNKWEMYQWFSMNEEIGFHLPYTQIYKSNMDIADIVKTYGRIYIKPVLGLRGHGIAQASIENGSYVVKFRDNGKNDRIDFETPDETNQFLKQRLNGNRYLIQKALDLLEYEGRIVDFRCIMQKSGTNKWECREIIGRCGEKGSVVSNISSGGRAFRAVDILNRINCSCKVDNQELIDKIKYLSIKICSILDEYGVNCGMLGLDIGIDKQWNLWLIEINNRDPDPSIALDIRDRKLYYTLKTGQLYYAKSLAGFNERDN